MVAGLPRKLTKKHKMREVTTPREIIDIIFPDKVDDKTEGTITPERIRQIVAREFRMSTYEGEDLFYPFESRTTEQLERIYVSEDERQELLKTIKRIREIIAKILAEKGNIVYMQVPEKSSIGDLRNQRWMKIFGRELDAKLLQVKKLKKSETITVNESPHAYWEKISQTTGGYDGNGIISFARTGRMKAVKCPQRDASPDAKDYPTLSFQNHLDIILGAMEGCKAIHDLGYAHNDIKPTNITIDPNYIDFNARLYDHEHTDKEGFDTGVNFGTERYADIAYYNYNENECKKSSQKRDVFAFGMWLLLVYMHAIFVGTKYGEKSTANKVQKALKDNIGIRKICNRPLEMDAQCLIGILEKSMDEVHEGSILSIPTELKQLIAEMIQENRQERPAIDEVIARLKSIKEKTLTQHTPPAFAKNK